MTTLTDYGPLLLGSRLRRLSEHLHAGVDQRYRAAGVTLSSRAFPLLFLLRDNGPTAIMALAAQIGQTHPVVVQLGRALLEAGVVTEQSDPKDERRRLLALSEDGRAMMRGLEPLWDDIRGAVDDALDDDAPAFMAALGRLEASLQAQPFGERVAARTRRRQSDTETLEIIDYAPAYAADFKRLNIEWLERYFYVEAFDNIVLSDPQRHILDGGGAIFFARLRGRIVGTCSLIPNETGAMELSKMAVTADCQGMGAGRRLIERALAAFEASGAPLLYLESNSKLAPALALYESVGFVHAPRPPAETHYQRANVYMEWRGRKA